MLTTIYIEKNLFRLARKNPGSYSCEVLLYAVDLLKQFLSFIQGMLVSGTL